MAHMSRWLPAIVAPLLVVGAVSVPIMAANASPSLPERSAAQILASISKAHGIEGFTGTLKQESNLGLPQLPAVNDGTSPTGQTGAASVLAALGTDQTLRVAVAREQGVRVQVLQAMGEQDLILNRGNLWQWDNASQQATHVRLPEATPAQLSQLQALQAQLPQTPVYSPQQLSEALITKLDAHTRVSVGQNRYVAGQTTYGLVFTPVERDTTVRDIQVQVDAKTGMPLRLDIYAKSQASPAYELGYTSLSYAVPAASTFDFTAPTGAKVKTLDYTLPKLEAQLQQLRGTADDAAAAGEDSRGQAEALVQQLLPQVRDLPQVSTRGTGWATVLEVPASKDTRTLLQNKSLLALTTLQPNGDRAISSTLVNAVIHTDGSVSVGAVPLSAL